MKTFIFDFDSTIYPGESLDEVIRFQIKDEPASDEINNEITNICNLGMSGSIGMKDSLKRRLDIAAPSQESIKQYIIENKERIENPMIDLLQNIRSAGNKVVVVSGGFEEWIIPLLNGIIPAENIHANQIIDSTKPMFYENITVRKKEHIIAELLSKENSNTKEIIMIGDGATDFSVYENGIADRFIGAFFYASMADRKKVVEKARKHEQLIFDDITDFVEHIKSLIS